MNIKDRLASLGGAAGIIYLGQAGFLLSFGGTTALVDPYLSYSVDRCTEKGDGLWTRRYPPPCLPEELDFVDYVFISHDHLDHADPETISAIAKYADAEFVCGAAIAEKVRSYGAARVIGMREGAPLKCGSFSVKLLPAAHEEIHRDGNGDCKECGFLFDFGVTRLYHSGDSLVYDGLTEAIDGADVLLLPVNGYGYFRRYADNCIGNMDSYDAARLAQAVSAKLLIPMHFDLYAGNSVPPEAVSAIISAAAPEIDFRLPEPGGGWKISSVNGRFTAENF